MMSRSYTNLLELASGNFPVMGREKDKKRFPRVMTLPGNIAELDDDSAVSVSSENQSSVAGDRMIIVANLLPLKAKRRPDNKGWSFSWNEDSVLLRVKDGFPDDMEVLYVGSLPVDVDPIEQDDVANCLLDKFKCVAAFLPPNILTKYYDGFCKKQLWPLFHYMLPYSVDHGNRFDRSMWEAYVSANKMFSQKVIEVLNPEDDFVWIHDYHLMVLPTFLRRRFLRLRMGFFLHSPFPSSEIYRSLPVREEILKALLNSDLIGFHTFDYARHFLSCCSRMLGLEYQSKRGYIGLDYYGRTVGIKIMPVGIHMGHIESVMRHADKKMKFEELKQQFEGKTVLLGVDDMDIFKGINLKLLAMEQMLKLHPNWQGRAVLVQIANPSRGKGIDVDEIQSEIEENCKRINRELGKPGYEPIVLIHRPSSISERMAYYSIAECVVVTAVRDGMNLTPYEYIVCRHGVSGAEPGSDLSGPKKSMLVVSEFIGCSPSLSGAIRVNPWNVESTAEAMNEAISMVDAEKELRHEKHYRYVSTHDVAFWSRSFLQDMERTCAEHFRKRCWSIGLGFGFRVVALDPNFRKLSLDDIVDAYCRAKSRVVLLDYDGTLMPQNSIVKTPSSQVISLLNRLSADTTNIVFMVSGRGRESLSSWFLPCKKLGLAAEHGYFLRHVPIFLSCHILLPFLGVPVTISYCYCEEYWRKILDSLLLLRVFCLDKTLDMKWPQLEEWETSAQSSDFGWMDLAEPVMKSYTEATDGSGIERKESALVWHYQDADPVFGFSQAKEMLDHLESVLANEPVAGVTKGLVAEKVFASMTENGKKVDFVLCVGDDRSDEDMFEIIGNAVSRRLLSHNTEVFACTVGQKPSKAKYYLDDSSEVIEMLESLADATGSPASSDEESESSPRNVGHVSFV
ncbi:putative alpha,alpha-trehalose-phosphate synthase [Dorcoceras hygrometricum]|uniref:Putative alpha,alpha-trehalose-phosphate synthase n=1 Tax=Dorcoceras hygrometricum TaxID=472368 RepID=A0A2Z7B1S4_9LAMI|nr:putative alpha,alpha-trehalose-phosphate synthase [Dorcoceras hygrometricum]